MAHIPYGYLCFSSDKFFSQVNTKSGTFKTAFRSLSNVGFTTNWSQVTHIW